MPLIQWIMQNLSVPSGTGGVKVGGSATVSVINNILSKGGVQVGGNGISFIVNPHPENTKTGVLVGGSAKISSYRRRKIKYQPGDTVYDSENRAWVVVSLEYDSTCVPQYKIANNYSETKLAESELQNEPIYVVGNANFVNSPLANLPIFAGRRIEYVSSYRHILNNSIQNRIQNLNSPLANLPIYEGLKIEKIKPIYEKDRDVSSKLADLNVPLANLPIYNGKKIIEIIDVDYKKPTIKTIETTLANLPVYPGLRKIKL